MNNADQPAMPTSTAYTRGAGLTKREHFACAAMNALLTHFGDYHEPHRLREQSYKIADVMLEECDE